MPNQRRRARDAAAIEEGLMLAGYAVRLQLKNRIEVATIGQDRAFDASAFLDVAAGELERLAEEQDGIADRLEQERAELRSGDQPQHVHDYRRADRRNLRRRARVARGLAEDLRERAADPAELAELVEHARQDAWRDVATVIEAVIDTGGRPPRRASSARKRRIADLGEELASLAAQRELDLDRSL